MAGEPPCPDYCHCPPGTHDYAEVLGFTRYTEATGPMQSTKGVMCKACGQSFTRVEGSVMRGHRRRCPVYPVAIPIPGRCDS